MWTMCVPRVHKRASCPLINSSIDRHVGCLHFTAIVNFKAGSRGLKAGLELTKWDRPVPPYYAEIRHFKHKYILLLFMSRQLFSFPSTHFKQWDDHLPWGQILRVSVLESWRERTRAVPVSKEINKNCFSYGLVATLSYYLSTSLCWWEQFPDKATITNGWWAHCKSKFLLAGWAAGLSLRKSVKQYHERNGSTLQTNHMGGVGGFFHVLLCN